MNVRLRNAVTSDLENALYNRLTDAVETDDAVHRGIAQEPGPWESAAKRAGAKVSMRGEWFRYRVDIDTHDATRQVATVASRHR